MVEAVDYLDSWRCACAFALEARFKAKKNKKIVAVIILGRVGSLFSVKPSMLSFYVDLKVSMKLDFQPMSEGDS